MIQPTLCIYHSNCIDGFSAAWSVWKRYGDTIRYHPGVHGEGPPEVTGEHVVIVDFSYKAAVLLEMVKTAASITVLDHHKSAETDLAPLLADGTIGGLFDMTRSGAVITWEYFHPGQPVPQLLLHVQDRDLWQFKLPFTREISSCLFSYPYDFDLLDHMVEELSVDPADMVTEGEAIERKHNKDIAELLKIVTRRMKIGGIDVPVANLPYTMASEAGNLLSQGESFAACYFDRADGRVFSLRSSGDNAADVSVIASGYGGGGHRSAAGFKMPIGWEGDA